MSDDMGIDPYAAVLADIDAQIERLQIAKSAIEAIRGNRPHSPEGVKTAFAPAATQASLLGPDAFLGMTIVDATKKLLGARRKTLNNHTISAELRSGGLVLKSTDPLNTINAVLTRRYKDVGDVVRVSRGTWGLKEWYPHTSFKRKLEAVEDGNSSDRSQSSPSPELDNPATVVEAS